MKTFIVDIALCNGCYACQIACKDEHVGNDWSPIAKPQPDTGQFWMRLTEHIKGTVPKVKMHYVPRLCQHCEAAPCMPACPIEGAIYRREDGLVIIDPEKCTGCKACADVCPYDAIFINEHLNVAQKCTGCAHLLDNGWTEPRCVDVCPTAAIKFGEESDFADEIARAEVLQPEAGTKPRVHYLNMPKKFVGGTLYDPIEDEVVIGATCTLQSVGGGESFTTQTDDFGDFWFHGLADDTFKLTVAVAGFQPLTVDAISTEKDVNLGDLALSK